MKKPRYLSEELSRHGRVCYYVRVPGRPRVRLHVTGLDDPKFDKLYAAALLGQTPPEKPAARKLEKAGVGSFREVCQRFYVALDRDPHLERKTKDAKRKDLEDFCQHGGLDNGRVIGDMKFERLDQTHVRDMMERYAATPAKANGVRKSLGSLYAWAVSHNYPNVVNPTLGVKRLPLLGTGAEPWGPEHVEQFVERHPPGTKPHLALMLLYWTGARRSDVVAFGRQHVKNGMLTYVQFKGRKKNHDPVVIPIADDLAEALKSVQGQMVFLHDSHGKPYSADAFGHWFLAQCRQAGLHDFKPKPHGLRKMMQTQLAEAGVAGHGLMAVAGHKTADQTAVYTQRANRKKLAAAAMEVIEGVRSANRIVAPSAGPKNVRQRGYET